MEKLYIEQGLGTKFEYSVVGKPQQNGKVERMFLTLYGRIGTIIIDTRIKEELR